jgi:hypothetical protein
MKTFTIPKLEVDRTKPPFWERAGSPEALVVITCPSGHPITVLRSTHKIGVGGFINPSVLCTEIGCSFGEWVILQDYHK